MGHLRKRLTYANVMSSIAVFLVIGGTTAFAAIHLSKNSVGTKQLKKNAVTAAKIKKNAVTTAKVKNGTVTTAKLSNRAVTSAKIAANAVGSTQIAANAVGNSHTQFVKVFKAGAVAAAGTEATSPKVELGSVGPFHFYGKCFEEGGKVIEKTYVELTSGTAILDSEDAAEFDSNTAGYLTPATPENKRALENQAEAEVDEFSADSSDEEFQASASDGTEITGLAGGTGAKHGNPPGGNGPFLASDSCIVGTVAVFGG
ncbi:MAG TPA: hypothetical protein VFP23_05890 [Solirubrobacterales bacterium]|nr:hypothetical protein [Solirubrobacterales bacterium]